MPVRLRLSCVPLLPHDQWRRRGECILMLAIVPADRRTPECRRISTRQGKPWAARTIQEIVKREFAGIYKTWSRPTTAPDATP